MTYQFLFLALLVLTLAACTDADETAPSLSSDTLAVAPFDTADAVGSRTLPSTFTPTYTPALAESMPAFSVPTVAGSTLDAEDLQGQVVLVNIWATWCGPCRHEIPDLLALQDTYGAEGLAVVGFSVDEAYNQDAVERFVEDMQIDYPVAVVGPSVVDQFGSVLGLPTTFVVDRNGAIVQRINGIVHPDRITPMLEDLLAN